MKRKFIIIIVTIFILLTVLVYALKIVAPAYTTTVLEAGNLIMAVLVLATFFMVTRQMDQRPAAFARGVSGGSFLKLMVCMVSMLVYVMLNRQSIHKPSVFALMGIYAIYTTAETLLLSKMAREKK